MEKTDKERSYLFKQKLFEGVGMGWPHPPPVWHCMRRERTGSLTSHFLFIPSPRLFLVLSFPLSSSFPCVLPFFVHSKSSFVPSLHPFPVLVLSFSILLSSFPWPLPLTSPHPFPVLVFSFFLLFILSLSLSSAFPFSPSFRCPLLLFALSKPSFSPLFSSFPCPLYFKGKKKLRCTKTWKRCLIKKKKSLT